ncbi:TIGR01212 family radical SAM protein [Alkalicella caledoniensis]|uniref:TIGR01212 family radical SAM protein n=1 Tax=Alkalicella caledoniensis TaxID=2731377 RepID=UPI001FE7E694|nr:TIGR01212 family radical SAM protein [Alkalicella caledoniensis]
MELYNQYSKYLVEKYGEKVYKLSINLPLTCPNRDGVCGTGGCTFCDEGGAGYERNESVLSVKSQLSDLRERIKKKYNAHKFIAYFQNYSNTYMPMEYFKKYIKDAIDQDIVQIAISTRPDCVTYEHLDYLLYIKNTYKIDISIELGLQTVNYHTLKQVHRGHTLAEYIDCVLMIKQYPFEICTHMILNLPWDNISDSIESAKILSSLKTHQVKLHSLFIVQNTIMENQFLSGEFELVSMEEYIKRVIAFLEHLDPSITVQRLIGRAPADVSANCNWNTSWWKIKESIEREMEVRNTFQGRLFNYLGGSGFKAKYK